MIKCSFQPMECLIGNIHMCMRTEMLKGKFITFLISNIYIAYIYMYLTYDESNFSREQNEIVLKIRLTTRYYCIKS